MGIKINWTKHDAPLWTVEKNPPQGRDLGPPAEILLGPQDQERLANAIKEAGNAKVQTVAPDKAVQQIRSLAKEIALRNLDSLALKAYAIALFAQTETIAKLNREPELISMVYLDKTTGLPVYSNTEADLMTFCQMFDPEPMLKAVLDSFSGWSVLGIQKFEGCRCGGDPVNLELKIRLHHSHEIKDGRFFIEQLLGIESDNQAHLEKHFSGFSQKSKANEKIMIVATSRASISLEGEFHGHDLYEFRVEEEQRSNEVKVADWRNVLENLLIQTPSLESVEETT